MGGALHLEKQPSQNKASWRSETSCLQLMQVSDILRTSNLDKMTARNRLISIDRPVHYPL